MRRECTFARSPDPRDAVPRLELDLDCCVKNRQHSLGWDRSGKLGMSRFRVSLLCIAAVMLAVSLLPLQAKGRQEIIANFQSGSLEMVIYTQEEQDNVAGYKVAHMGIANGASYNIFAFNLEEWNQLAIFYREAASTQSRDWRIVGSMTERGTSDSSHLTISAGPGVRFVIGSVQLGSVAYDLSRSDMARFEQALYVVKASLSQ